MFLSARASTDVSAFFLLDIAKIEKTKVTNNSFLEKFSRKLKIVPLLVDYYGIMPKDCLRCTSRLPCG